MLKQNGLAVSSAKPVTVQLEQVCKNYGNVAAVKNVSLEIYGGELFSLLGGSGCGKTTLLRILAGFERPSSGRVFIDGLDMTDVPPYARPVNMMFQNYALFPHMSVFDNIAFGLKQERCPKAEIKQRVDDALQMVQLTEFAARKPAQLSGGQKQRVALARALIKRPKVLLLDEPLGALDKKLREQTQFELVNIQEKMGITFIVVTHDQEEAMSLSTRMAVMRAGEIVQIGSPQQIYEQPNSVFVADFIGSVNLLQARLLGMHNEHYLLESTDLGGKVIVAKTGDLPMAENVTLALRPEKITIQKIPLQPADDLNNQVELPNQLSGQIVEISYVGNLSAFWVQLDNGFRLRVTQPNKFRVLEGALTWGDKVKISFAPNAAQLLTQ